MNTQQTHVMKILSFILLIVFSVTVIVPITRAQMVMATDQFDSTALYEIRTTSTMYSNIPGSSLAWQGDFLRVKQGEHFIHIAKQDIQEIWQFGIENPAITKKKGKRNTLTGLAIGAGTGVVLGTITGLLVANSDNSSCEDKQECEGLSALAGAILGGGIFITSSLTGLLIGAFTKKKEKKLYGD